MAEESPHQKVEGVCHDDQGNEKNGDPGDHQGGVGSAGAEIALGPAEGAHEPADLLPVYKDQEAEDDADEANEDMHDGILGQMTRNSKPNRLGNRSPCRKNGSHRIALSVDSGLPDKDAS